jgi:AraC family transcriptional activator of tynA and feaB
MAEWSTDTVRARERFSYWREAVCQTIFNLTIEAPDRSFSARMATRSVGPVRIALAESTRYDVVRGPREVANDTAEHYSIYLQLSNQAVISQCSDTFTFEPNDIAISDVKYPFRAQIAGKSRRITTVIPHEMIDRRAPWVRKTALRRLASRSPYVDLAGRHILEMARNDAISDSAATLLTENLCNLLALASATDVAPGRMQPELQIEAMLAFCRRHLGNAELTPHDVAAHLGVSVRTLHSRFRQIGQSFGRWMRDERLRACSAALRDRSQRNLNISEIAYRWGFNDLSHFNRSFRAMFGRTPGEWRDDGSA